VKVLIVLNNLNCGGVETHFIALAEELTYLGVEVVFAVIRLEGALQHHLPRDIEVVALLSDRVVKGLRWHEFQIRGRRILPQYIVRLFIDIFGGAHRRLRDLYNRFYPDVVLSSLWESDVIVGLSLRRAKLLKRPKWVVTVEFDFERQVLAKRYGKYAFLFLLHFYKRTNAFVAPSVGIYRQLKSLVLTEGISAKRIPNAIQIGRIRSLAREDSIRPGPSDGLLIVAVGSLVSRKRFDVLLEAFEKVKKEVPETSLIIVGDGPLKSHLDGLANELCVGQSVTFAGFQSNPFPYMARADLLVMSSDCETFGNVVAEAMALGTPVVATRCGGPEDIVSHGEDGALTPVGDPDALAVAVVELLQDPMRRRRMGEKARRKAERMSDAARVARHYRDWLMTVLGE